MFRLTPLTGSRWTLEGDPRSSCLVEYGDARLLWNIGALPEGDLPPHDALLWSHARNCEALPLYHRRFPDTPIFATFPTTKLGQFTLYDLHAGLCLDGQSPSFSLEDVDAAISHVTLLKYSQTVTLRGLLLTAQRAGHVLGAAVWRLHHTSDETTVFLSDAYSVARERHLDAAQLWQAPDVWVTKPGSLAEARLVQKKALPAKLVDAVLAVLRRDGNVWLPADAAGRVVELLVLLDQSWEPLSGAYTLVWYGPLLSNIVNCLNSQFEWMRLEPTKLFQHVKLIHSKADWQKLTQQVTNPICVVTSGLTLDEGPSRHLLLEWADQADSAVIFTDSCGCLYRPEPRLDDLSKWTVAGQLLQAWSQNEEMPDSVWVDVPVPQRATLQGAELRDFMASEEAIRQQQAQEAKEQAMLAEVERAKGELRLDDEKVVPNNDKLQFMRPRKKSRFDSNLFLKYSKPLHCELVFARSMLEWLVVM